MNQAQILPRAVVRSPIASLDWLDYNKTLSSASEYFRVGWLFDPIVSKDFHSQKDYHFFLQCKNSLISRHSTVSGCCFSNRWCHQRGLIGRPWRANDHNSQNLNLKVFWGYIPLLYYLLGMTFAGIFGKLVTIIFHEEIKMNVPYVGHKLAIVFQPSIFSCENVSFREGNTNRWMDPNLGSKNQPVTVQISVWR